MSEVNVNYHFDAFERASEIMRKSITALEKNAARQQIAAMAMCALLSDENLTIESRGKQFDRTPKNIAKASVACADALIAELKKTEK